MKKEELITLVQRIADEKVDPIEGMQQVVVILDDVNDKEPNQGGKYVYENISPHIAKLYGLYDAYRDSLEPGFRAFRKEKKREKTKQEIVRVAKLYIAEVRS